MAALLLITASALIVYRQQWSPITKPGDTVTDNRKDKTEPQAPVDRGNEQQRRDFRLAETKPSSRKPTRKAFKPDLNKLPQVKTQQIEPDLIAQAPATDESVNPESSTSDLTENRNMLRIEIQTADPNIRIIWLAPKPDTSPTTPNTK
jgi:hypothetical protein